MDQEFFEAAFGQERLSDGPTPFINLAQLQAECRGGAPRAPARLPLADLHKNHVGIAYAGSSSSWPR